MSRIIKYTCNMCREEIQKENIKAFYFNATIANSNQTFGNYEVCNRINDCDSHICIRCIRLIKESKA